MTAEFYLLVEGSDGLPFERHVGLTQMDKAQLLATLTRLQDKELIRDFTLDKVLPDFHTIGYDETIAAVIEELHIEEDGSPLE